MALDFETWQMLALSETEVFLTQRKIPSLLTMAIVLSAEGTSFQARVYPLEEVTGVLHRPCHFCGAFAEIKSGGSPESVKVESCSSLWSAANQPQKLIRGQGKGLSWPQGFKVNFQTQTLHPSS